MIIIYCLMGTALYYLQDRLLFRPVALKEGENYSFKQSFTEANIDLDTKTKINIVQFIPMDDTVTKGVVLYFHGNRENINHYQQHSNDFTRNHYEVWMPDYPGYGKSTGEISEKILYDAALQVYKLARTKYQPNQIIIYGKSMGTGIAAELASVRDCKTLILETPYYSLTSLVRLPCFIYPVDWMLRYKIPTHEFLKKVTAPIVIFHGTSDHTIPYFNAKRLKQVLKPQDEFITIDGGAHNDLTNYPVMQKKLDSLLQK